MVLEIYSKVNPELLLHMVNRKEDITYTRNDISPADKFLQVSAFRLHEGQTFKAHKHIENIRTISKTCETWIILEGSVKALLYDIDHTLLEEVILNQGDLSLTFDGPHNYVSLSENTCVIEAKNGPFISVDKDKVLINQK